MNRPTTENEATKQAHPNQTANKPQEAPPKQGTVHISGWLSHPESGETEYSFE